MYYKVRYIFYSIIDILRKILERRAVEIGTRVGLYLIKKLLSNFFWPILVFIGSLTDLKLSESFIRILGNDDLNKECENVFYKNIFIKISIFW